MEGGRNMGLGFFVMDTNIDWGRSDGVKGEGDKGTGLFVGVTAVY